MHSEKLVRIPPASGFVILNGHSDTFIAIESGSEGYASSASAPEKVWYAAPCLHGPFPVRLTAFVSVGGIFTPAGLQMGGRK